MLKDEQFEGEFRRTEREKIPGPEMRDLERVGEGKKDVRK